MKKVSKYDLDRGTVDIQKMLKERQAERKSKNLMIKDIVEKETAKNIKEEVQAKQIKIESLNEIKHRQDVERKEMVHRNQKVFRKVMEERKAAET
jgi:hypothetical protein